MQPPDTLRIKVDFGHFFEQLPAVPLDRSFFFFKPLSDDIAQKTSNIVILFFSFNFLNYKFPGKVATELRRLLLPLLTINSRWGRLNL